MPSNSKPTKPTRNAKRADNEAAKPEADKQAQRAEQRAKARGTQFGASLRIAQYAHITPRLKAYARFYAEHADESGNVVIAALPARNPHYAGSNRGDDRACVAGMHNHGLATLSDDGLRLTFTPEQRAAALATD